MSATTDALAALFSEYGIDVTAGGDTITVPLDPTKPRVAISMDELAYHLLYRLDREYGLDVYDKQFKVKAWLDSRSVMITSHQASAPVAVRSHQLRDDDGPRLLIDVGDPEIGFFIDVRAGSWTLVDPRAPGIEDAYPVDDRPIFARPQADYLPLPIPVRPEVRGSAREWLRVALNLSDRDWRLVWGWLLSAYFSQWDRQGLLFVAPTKLGKTLRASWLLRFIHPVDSRADGIGADLPKDQREWGSLIADNPVLAFDDVEHITAKDHANLKRVATGVAFKTQTLYKTRGLTVTRGKRPMLITASGTPSGLRDDLRNRLWLIEPTAPPVGERLRSEFERMAPAIFADLLDDLTEALTFYGPAEREIAQYISDTGIPVRPLEITALFRALDRAQGLDPATGFEQAARDALADSLMEAAQGDRFAYLVRVWLSKPANADGGKLSSQAMLTGLTDTAMDLFPDVMRLDREDWFPNDTTRMGAMFSRKADSLQAAGIHLSQLKLDRNTRGWEWAPIPEEQRLQPAAPPSPMTVNVLSPGAAPELPE